MGPSRQADLVVAMLPHMIATARILRPEFRRLSHARYLKHNEFTVHVEIIDIDGRADGSLAIELAVTRLSDTATYSILAYNTSRIISYHPKTSEPDPETWDSK